MRANTTPACRGSVSCRLRTSLASVLVGLLGIAAIPASAAAHELANPNASLDFLTFEFDYINYQGDLRHADRRDAWRIGLQPSLPYPLAKGTNFLPRRRPTDGSYEFASLGWPGGTAYGEGTTTKPAAKRGGQELGEIGAKLSNPASDVWAVFSEFDLTFSDGDLNSGDAQIGGRMIFQPILPFPIYGEGKNEWRLITRPTLPVIFSTAIPTGFDEFDHKAGLGDSQLPIVMVPSENITGNWSLGLGPTWLIPTGTRDDFTRDQWGVGPAVFTGYRTEKWLAGGLLQYTWRIDGSNDDDEPDASYGSLLYYFSYNLADAWQVGFAPTITYDHEATSGNRWNVPIGPLVAKTVEIGETPVKLQLAMEYSVVSQDDFGQRAQIRLNIIPVIPGLVQEPVFGK